MQRIACFFHLRAVRIALFILASNSFLLAASAAASAQTRVHRAIQAPPLLRYSFPLVAGTAVTFETDALSAGSDTVLHVWDDEQRAEVAYNDDIDSAIAGRRSKVTFTPSHAGIYELIVRPYSPLKSGVCDVLKDRVVVGSRVAFGGTFVPLALPSNRVETALSPNGATDTVLLALGVEHLLALDDDSGVGLASSLIEPAGAVAILVGSNPGADGTTNLYVNDVSADADGDGLGAALERELGTCDAKTDPLQFFGDFGCASVFNTQDTDNDGLSDAAEVFGIDATPPQLLPRWGADPRHKDLFVQVDYTTQFASQPVTGADILAVQKYYAEGPASDLRNPDGANGVRIHCDIGVDPTNPADAVTYGNWGGSKASNDSNFYTAPNTNRVPARAGVFRYALATLSTGGGGMAASIPSDRFYWGVSTSDRYVRNFAHELGHTAGLYHEGHPRWGSLNCKPNYPSLMNYAFTDPPSTVGFSLGAIPGSLDPSAVSELQPTVPWKELSSGFPFPASAAGIDWNGDGRLFDGASGAVRASVNWSLSCPLSRVNVQLPLQNNPFGAASPKLVRAGDRLYAFYTTKDGRLAYVHAPIAGPDANGSCPGGGALGDACTTWSGEQSVPGVDDVKGFSAIEWKGAIRVMLRKNYGGLSMGRTTARAQDGSLTWSAYSAMGVMSTIDPELGFMYVRPELFHGASQVMMLFYADDKNHRYMYSTDYESGTWTWWDRGAVLPDLGVSGVSPSVATWPPRGDAPYGDPAHATICGAFQGTAFGTILANLTVACYEKETDTWSRRYPEFPAPAGFRRSLLFHTFRGSGGAPLDGDVGEGAFWMFTSSSDGSGSRVSTFRRPAPGEPLTFDDRVASATPAGAKAGTGESFFEDATLSAPKAVVVTSDDALAFLPFVDGSVRVKLTDGNDYQVMESTMCKGIRDAAYCGTTGYWNY